MKNQDGGLKVPFLQFLELKQSECHKKLSLVPMHELIVPSTLLPPAIEIRTLKATKIHTLKSLMYELFFEKEKKSSEKDLSLAKLP